MPISKKSREVAERSGLVEVRPLHAEAWRAAARVAKHARVPQRRGPGGVERFRGEGHARPRGVGEAVCDRRRDGGEAAARMVRTREGNGTHRGEDRDLRGERATTTAGRLKRFKIGNRALV